MRAIAIFLLLSAVLAGCTSLARPIAEAAVSTDEIVRAVECELASVFLDESVNSRILMASHSLTKLDLVVTDDNAISPGLSFETKTRDMTITAVPRNRFGDKTIRTAKMDFITNFSDIAPNTEIGQGLRARCPARGSALASKGLGLSDWLHQVLTSVPRADSAAQLQTLSYVADFTVTRNIGGGLTFKTTIASLGLNEAQINRQRQNKIDVFIKVEPVPAATPRGRTPVSESVVNELRRLQSEEREEDRTVIQVEPGQIVTVQ